ncbi:MAG: hypothetical protein AAF725_22035 [Acidobacteriota bacterium]
MTRSTRQKKKTDRAVQDPAGSVVGVLAWLAWTLLAPQVAAGADPVPVGAEMRVNQVTAGRQQNATLDALADGTFVVMWEGEDGDGRGIFGRLLGPGGLASGNEFLVSTSTADDQVDVDVATLPGGDFVAVWKTDASEPLISSRRFDSAGLPSPEVEVFPPASQVDVFEPEIEAASDGSFVVIWESYDLASSSGDIRGRLLSGDGLPSGGSFDLLAGGSDRVFSPAVSSRPSGGFVLSWSLDSSTRELRGRSYDELAAPVGQEVTLTTGQTLDPGVVALDDESYLGFWSTSAEGLKRRRAETDGSLDGEIDVSPGPGPQLQPAAVRLTGGRAALAWRESAAGQPRRVRLQILGASGAVEGEVIVDETPLTLSQPRLAYDALRSQLGVVWTRRGGPDSDQEEVYLMRYALDVIFADGFETGDTAAWAPP